MSSSQLSEVLYLTSLRSYILNRGWVDRSSKRVPTYNEITRDDSLENDEDEDQNGDNDGQDDGLFDEDDFDDDYPNPLPERINNIGAGHAPIPPSRAKT